MTPVLILRPGERGDVLAATLHQHGFEVQHLNTLTLAPLPEDAELRSFWLNFDQFHKVVVISPFAAQCLAQALDRYWPQLPVGNEYYCVGRSTAEILHQQLGVKARVHESSHHEDTSEALLALPSLQCVEQRKILIVAGEGGRDVLVETLRKRGARVTRASVYQRRYQPPDPGGIARLQSGNFKALMVTSSEQLQHLSRWCNQAALNQPLIVSSHRLATLASGLGFSAPTVARGATPAALTAALTRTCNPPGADVDQGT